MTKTKKLLIALLSVSCLTAGAFAFTACGDNTANSNPEINAIYQQYVAYAESNGENVLSYEDWLATIKGEKGDNGKDGTNGTNGKSAYELYLASLGESDTPLTEEQWLASLKGETGVGVEKVEISADGTKLIVTYTDKTTSEIALHQHDYDTDGDGVEEYVTIVEPTKDTEGLGYKTCKEDGHKELVVIPKLEYVVTVKYYDGTLVSGVKVSINDATGVTDSNGVAKVSDFGKFGEYNILLPELDSAYSYAGGKTSKYSNEVEVILYKGIPATGICEEGQYGITINWSGSWCEGYSAEFASETPKKFNVTVSGVSVSSEYVGFDGVDDSGDWIIDETDEVSFAVADGQNYELLIIFDDTVLTRAENPIVTAIINVEELETPSWGSQELPLKLEFGENTKTITADTDTYFKYVTDYSEFALEFGENVTVTYLGTNVTGTNDTAVTSGANIDGLSYYYDAYFKVTSTDGNVAIKVIKAPGAKENPKTITELGTVSGSGHVWYKYVATEDVNVTIEGADNGSLYVYAESGYESENDLAVLSYGEKYSIDMKSGEVYYFEHLGYGDYSFVLRDFNADTDAGIITAPIELTVGTETTSYTVSDSLYFKVTANADGIIALNPNVTEGKISFVNYYSDSSFSSSSMLSDRSVSEGDVIYIKVIAGTGATFTLNPAITAADATFDHVFTVKSGETALAGITVNAMDGETVVATGTTAADGTVTLNMVPGEYTIELEGLAANYQFNGLTTELPSDGSYDHGHNYDVVVDELVTYTVTISKDSAAVEGVTLNILVPSEYTSSGWSVASTTTVSAADGTITFSVVKGGTYRIQIATGIAGYEYRDENGNNYVELDENQLTVSMALTEKQLPVIAIGETGTTFTLSELEDKTFTAKVTAETAGEYVLSMTSSHWMFAYVTNITLTVNGTEYTVSNHSATITLPAEEVVVTIVFADSAPMEINLTIQAN